MHFRSQIRDFRRDFIKRGEKSSSAQVHTGSLSLVADLTVSWSANGETPTSASSRSAGLSGSSVGKGLGPR